MLNRRQLRVKVVQAIYAYEQSGNDRMDLGEKELFVSLENINRLFVTQLSLLLEVSDFASLRIEEAKKKYFPTEEEKNPSIRFIENRVLGLIRNNIDVQRKIKAYKISWRDEKDMIRKIDLNMKESELYLNYIHDAKDSFQSDKSFLDKFYMQSFVGNEALESFYEEQNIHWASDLDIVNNLILRYIKSIKEECDETFPLPQLFPIDNIDGVSEDKLFVRDLFRKTILHHSEYTAMIAERAVNWEFDRIATMDKLLLRMAVTELLEFSSIPIKVTLNEYIELSKIFSTPRSRIFINGILDKLIAQCRAEGKINKTGRGLMDK